MGAVLWRTIVVGDEGRSRIHSVSESELEDMEGFFSTYSWQVARKSRTRQWEWEEAYQRDLFSFNARDFNMIIQLCKGLITVFPVITEPSGSQ